MVKPHLYRLGGQWFLRECWIGQVPAGIFGETIGDIMAKAKKGGKGKGGGKKC